MEINNDLIKKIKRNIAGIIFAAVIALLYCIVPRIVYEINGFDAVSFCVKYSALLYTMLCFIIVEGIVALRDIRKLKENLKRTT